MTNEELVEQVCSDTVAESYTKPCDCAAVAVAPGDLLTLMKDLFNLPKYNFIMLCDHTAVDRLDAGVFELVYRLFSPNLNQALMVSTEVPRDKPVVPTVCSVWRIAEWQEREVYDLFGVLYDEHPDLRRVFLEDEWQGFPLRKDYKDDFILIPEVPS